MKKKKFQDSKNSRKPSRHFHKKGGKAESQKKSALKIFEGNLKVHRDGYGFVLSEKPGVPDVFVPSRRMEGAMDGDRVLVSVRSSGDDGRLEGSVQKILNRGTQYLVAELKHIRHQDIAVVIEGGRVMEFLIPPKKLAEAKAGQSVGIKILKYPEGFEQGVGEVVKVFQNRGEEATELDVVILSHQLPTQFSPEALREARGIQENSQIELSEGREDLRSVPFVTIDGETAKDFDDAICVRPERGGYRLWVSIADVGHYVKPETALDRDAFRRGTSVYFPGACIPMLPEELSNDLCSLRPHEDRLSFTCEIFFNLEGHPHQSRCYKSLIRSKGRLTYTQVARAVINEDAEVQRPIQDLMGMLRDAMDLSRILRKVRFARGSIDFDLPEPEIIQNLEEGGIEKIIKAERNEAHFLIEEFMIAANEAVARFLTQQKWPTLYRVHDEPDPAKLENFHILLNNLGFNIAFPKHPHPKFFNKILQTVQGHPEAQLVQHILLRSMKQAVYSEKNLGHFGLASSCYTHFTSPIRRYPDLVVHRILHRALLQGKGAAGKARDAQLNDLAILGAHTSRRERVAMEAEWEAIALKSALFMKRFLGESFDGVISRIAKFGFFVELKEYFVEGVIKLEDLEEDYYVFDEKKHRLRGRRGGKVFKIGVEVRVRVAKVDVEERKIHFVLE